MAAPLDSLLFAAGAAFAPPLDTDERRTQHAIADGVAGLHDLHDGARRHRRIRHLVHRLLEVRVELLALRIELLDAVLFQRIEQRALGELDALDQRGQAGIGRGTGLGRNGIERTLEIVGDVEHVAGEAGDAVEAGIGDFLGGALAQIFHLGQRPQHAVARLGGFLLQQLDRAGLRIVGHDVGF